MSHRRLLAPLLALVASLGGLAAAAQTSSTVQADRRDVESHLRLERKLLALDLASYREARQRDRQIQEQVVAAAAQLDEALDGDSLALGSLEALHDGLVATQAAARIASERVEQQLQRLEDRLRRIAFLEGELGIRAEVADPVSGRWQVVIQPQGAAAVFDLSLQGTVVSGEYQIGGVLTGSFRGTYSGGRLRLERIDSRGGFDSTFEGTVDAGAGRIRGTWTANELASGQPARGEWTGVRVGDSPAQNDVEEEEEP